MQLFISNIPEEALDRAIRRSIGVALKNISGTYVKFKIKIKRRKEKAPARAVLTIEEGHASSEHLLRDHLLNRRYPVICQGRRLRIDIDNRIDPEEYQWDLKQIKATRLEDVASDYESDHSDEDTQSRGVRKKLFIKQVSSGAWDGNGHYVDAWRSRCNGGSQCVRIDEDLGRLFIESMAGIIRINLYDIRYSIHDPQKKEYYIILRNLPAYFITTTSSEKEQITTRVSSFNTQEHAMCAPYSYVFRVQYVSPLHQFLRYHCKRLGQPDQLHVEKSAITVLMTKKLEEDMSSLYRSLSFDSAFQAQALVTAWQVLPVELWSMRETITELDRREIDCAARIRSLASEIKWRDPRPSAAQCKTFVDLQKLLLRDWIDKDTNMHNDKMSSEDQARAAFNRRRREVTTRDAVWIHSVMITPAGMQLIGPNPDPGNRILRTYPGLDNQYLRVSLKEETGELIRDDKRHNNTGSSILDGKFRNALLYGVTVAGVKFEFLAFSNSQLKSHSCWFVRSPLIVEGGKMITPQDIRDSIGNLSKIKCPPRFAARLGQAFTTTFYSIKVPLNEVFSVPDIKSKCGRYEFSDGVGKISPEMVAQLNIARRKELKAGKRDKAATVFQIRLDGAKGVLALDSRMQGRAVHLRPSMIKFQSSDALVELSVAKSYTEPGQCYLNRPLIALLETLGVPYKAFKDMQDEALQRIDSATKTTTGAARLMRDQALGQSTRISSTLRALENEFGYTMRDIIEIPFFKEVIRTAIFHSLRSIKYKAHVRINKAYLLMGIMDESGMLPEGQIYVCLRDGNGRRCLKGPTLVYRSPTLHPGDVQMVEAIGEVPKTSMLYSLTNCLVFSQRGARPLPSMLAGGDLDGDEYSVVQDERLFPPHLYRAAEYAPLKPEDIGRAVNTTDIIDFFLKHIVTSKVGMLATRHLIISDQSEDGVFDPKCIELADLYSKALDYPKTGVLPDLRSLPHGCGRPDYMESEYLAEERSNLEKDNEGLKVLGRSANDFYMSDKALGRLFRDIEVPLLLGGWGLEVDDAVQYFRTEKLSNELLSHLRPLDDSWIHYINFHRGLVEFYYKEQELLANGFHTGGRMESLSPAEVFLGCISVRTPYQSRKQLYETSESLRADYRSLIGSFIDVACNPPNIDAMSREELADNIRKYQPAIRDVEGELLGHYDYDDEDDDNQTIQNDEMNEVGQYIHDAVSTKWNNEKMDMDDDRDEVETQGSWASIDSSSMEDRKTNATNVDEEAQAKRVYLSLYSLFWVALEAQKKDEEKATCPWVVFPRLIAARNKVDKLCIS